ncbi:tRNA (guanine(9)-N1)-methyltransferase [Exophiala dermatitidis]
MEAAERPTKMRKLDSHAEPSAVPQDTRTPDQPLLSGVEVNGAVVPTTNTTNDNKPADDAASHNADVANGQENVEREDSETDEHSQNQNEEQDQESKTTSTDPAQQDGQPLSKNQLKKLRKKQEWEAGREYRKLKRKQKMQEKRARKREAREGGGEQDPTSNAGTVQQQNQRKKPRKPVLLPVTIIIDCSFDDLMIEKERISLGSQITRSYSDNSRAPFQAHLVISSWGGHLKKRFDTVLNKHYLNWRGVTFLEEDFVEAARRADEIMRGPRGGKLVGVFEKYAAAAAAAAPSNRLEDSQHNQQGDQTTTAPEPGTSGPAEAEADPTAGITKDTTAKPPSTSSPSLQNDSHQTFQNDSAASSNLESAQKDNQPSADLSPQHTSTPIPKGEVIYLTSDSPDTLTELSPYSTYIVGGLVDKNRHKGICYKIARERGIKTAKLPIGEYMEMQSRKVLATNHVVEIMVRWLECGDWGEAFLKVIPKRKGGRLRGDHDERTVDSSVAGDEEREDEDDHEDEDVDHDNDNRNGAAADGANHGNEATELEPQVENQD